LFAPSNLQSGAHAHRKPLLAEERLVESRNMTESQPFGNRIAAEVQRAIDRNIKGLEYLSSPGPSVGNTPKDILISRGTLNLYHYRPMADEIYRVPLLVVMATTNRGYIVDLSPGQSLVEFLLKQGYDVYLIDWTAPRPEEKALRFEDYVLDFIPQCIRRVQDESGEEDITLVGYCMGGVLSLMYAAIHPDGPLKNLVCFATPVDWRHMELFQKWSDRRYFDVDRLVDSLGNIPGEFFYSSFDMLRPASRSASQILLWERIWDDPYVKSFRMFEKWSTEVLPLAGEYFRQTTKELMWDNKLYTGKLSINGRRADLKNITVPVFHAVAQHDHIVPYGAARPLVAGVGSVDKEEIMLKGGHVSLIAGPNAAKRLWPKLDSWLQKRST
jgi:polyhydroxyalkanoate synthase